MTMIHHSNVYEALALLGVTDPEAVQSVLIGRHAVAVTRYAEPKRLGDDGNVVTEVEYIDIDWTPTVITAPDSRTVGGQGLNIQATVEAEPFAAEAVS